jgi:hypothetical protein
MGSRTPAIAATSVDQPAVALSTTGVAMSPLVVRTPAHLAAVGVDAGDLGA